MKFLILGEGPDEHAWARVLEQHPEHEVVSMYPGFKDLPELPGQGDFEAALAVRTIEASVVGGAPELRAEGLRRAAAEGWRVLALHPPGDDADPYYQVALSPQETGAVIVPDLPLRLHPGIVALRETIQGVGLGAFHELRYERPVGPNEGGLLSRVFPRAVDVVRALLGEIHSVNAHGDPPGPKPTEALVVLLRDTQQRRAEIRLRAGPIFEPARLSVVGSEGSLTLEHDPGFSGPSRLVRHPGEPPEAVTELPAWDARAALLHVLAESRPDVEFHPDLLDGTRAMELAEATARSLRRGRTIDLHPEQVSEANTFKSLMTSLGCFLLLGALVILPLALAGPALGFDALLYLAYAIPPVLVLFVLLQLLRLGIRERPTRPGSDQPRNPPKDSGKS